MKRETIAFIVQGLVLFASLVWGYASLSSEVKQLRSEMKEVKSEMMNDLGEHRNYLLRDTWMTRNDLVDRQLSRIEEKLDTLIDKRQCK